MRLRAALLCLLCCVPGLVVAQTPAAEPKAEPAADAKAEPAADAKAEPAADAKAEPAADAKAEPAADAGSEMASSADRETELTTRLPQLVAEDELQWLEADGGKFFAFNRKPKKGKPRGAILIVPAPGEFIDQRALIRTLRGLPPAGGFQTLAMQPPLKRVADGAAAAPSVADAAQAATEETATPDAAPTGALPIAAGFCPRVAAALAALSAEGAPMLAIVTADDSTPALLGCYPDGLPSTVHALAAVGGWQGSVAALKVPFIEFVPERDPAAVAAADRRAAVPVEDGAPPRRRVDLHGIDRYFGGADVDIAKRLRGWLEHLPPPAKQKAADAG